MRELQNMSLAVLTLVLVVVFLTASGCSNLNAEVPNEVPNGAEPRQPATPNKICWKTERFTFDTAGVDAIETRVPVKCEGMIAKNE
tara:strand:- start:447 stop:704 length:258 start_codon:yes stop_codon:yes gene_type:complete